MCLFNMFAPLKPLYLLSVAGPLHLSFGVRRREQRARAPTHTPLPVPQLHSDVFCLVLFVSLWGLPFATRPPQLPEGSITDRGGSEGGGGVS